MHLKSRIAWFLVAGLVGFAVDAGVLTALIGLGVDARLARIPSFLVAMTATWLINRRFAFRDRVGPPSMAEFLRYAVASSGAALINLGAFFCLVTWGYLVPRGDVFASYPVLALIVSTGLSMSVNFWNYLNVVFKPKPRTDA